MRRQSGLPFQRGAALVGEPPNTIAARLFGGQEPPVDQIMQPFSSPGLRKPKHVSNLNRRQCGVVRACKDLQYLRITNRRFPTGHTRYQHVRSGVVLYHRNGISSSYETGYRTESSYTPKTNTVWLEGVVNDLPGGKGLITWVRIGPNGPAVVEQPMKATHDRTRGNDLGDNSYAGLVAESIPSTVQHRRQMRGIVNRLPLGDDDRETLREVVDESR